MKFENLEDFYQVYDQHRTYVKAEVRKKHIKNFDNQIWHPANFMSGYSVLELGTGTGLFLSYLEAKKVSNFIGIDSDPKTLDFMPASISERVVIGDLWAEIDKLNNLFDRIVLLDVFEHFSYFEGRRLLELLKGRLKEGGKVILRIPNASSPFGLQYQYNDLTHKAVYGPGSIRHLALAAGFGVDKCFSAYRGNAIKRAIEQIVLGAIKGCLTEPPPLWGANMMVIISPLSKMD